MALIPLILKAQCLILPVCVCDAYLMCIEGTVNSENVPKERELGVSKWPRQLCCHL